MRYSIEVDPSACKKHVKELGLLINILEEFLARSFGSRVVIDCCDLGNKFTRSSDEVLSALVALRVAGLIYSEPSYYRAGKERFLWYADDLTKIRSHKFLLEGAKDVALMLSKGPRSRASLEREYGRASRCSIREALDILVKYGLAKRNWRGLYRLD